MSHVTVRDARLEDAGRLLEIYAYYVEHTAISFEYAVPTLEEFRARMERTMARYPYLVVEDGGVCGYAYAGPFIPRSACDWSCEASIYLDRHARRRGMGRALYEALADRLREMGIVNLYACVAVPEVPDEYLDRSSVDFHTRMGFAEAGVFRRCGCKFGRWYHLVWLEKSIGPHVRDPLPVVPPKKHI